MVGQMSLQDMRAVNFKRTTGRVFAVPASLVLAVLLILGCESAKRNHPQMDHSSVRLTIAFPEWRSDQSTSQVVLTYSNPTGQPRTVVLPCPLNENATSFGSSEKPVLVLIAKELLTSSEEGFTLTDWSNSTGDRAKTLTLKPSKSAEVPFPLASFYSWGHAGPIENKGFLECLRTGEREVAVRAIVAYSDIEPEKGEHIESPPVVLKCAFPEWLFKTKPEMGR
jgi:hypothetical protein